MNQPTKTKHPAWQWKLHPTRDGWCAWNCIHSERIDLHAKTRPEAAIELESYVAPEEYTLEQATKEDSETLLAFVTAPHGRFGFRDQLP